MSTSKRTLDALVEVKLTNGSTWRGTERELRREHPDWLKYAKRVQVEDEEDETGHDDEIDFDFEAAPTRLPTNTRTYAPVSGRKVNYQFEPEIIQTKIPPRRSAQQRGNVNKAVTPDVIQVGGKTYVAEEQVQTDGLPQLKKKRASWHPVLYLGIGMTVMIVLWTLLTLFAGWWSTTWDDIHYGRPRTFQIDYVVGHNDDPQHPTHFIAVNLDGKIRIIELPGGDSTNARIYNGPTLYGDGASLAPITLTFQDVNGDGHIDMLVHFQNSQIIYLNEKVNGIWQFVPQSKQ